jgi:hypothetical protein
LTILSYISISYMYLFVSVFVQILVELTYTGFMWLEILFLLRYEHSCWLIGWSCGWGETYVSEPPPPTGLLLIPQVMRERGQPWWWWCRLGKTPDSCTRVLWQSYQQRHLGANRRDERRSDNFAYLYMRYVNGYLTCRKVLLRHGASSFASLPKEGLLRIFITLKNPSPQPGLNPRPLGPVASALITTSPRRLTFMLNLLHS